MAGGDDKDMEASQDGKENEVIGSAPATLRHDTGSKTLEAGNTVSSSVTAAASPGKTENVEGSSPLTTAVASSSQANSNPFTQFAASSGGFVFGQNIVDRVTGVEATEIVDSTTTAELDFAKARQINVDGQSAADEAKSLSESAKEYEAKQSKPLLREVEVTTGEETESNVLQVHCKLYIFEKTQQSWIERGRGMLRLNDMGKLAEGAIQSRLVIRTQGSLRVVLNTKVWSGMSPERPSDKSVRITALDEDSIKVYLIMGSKPDMDSVFSAIEHRVKALKEQPVLAEAMPRLQEHARHAAEAAAQEPSTTTGPALSTGAKRESSDKSDSDTTEPAVKIRRAEAYDAEPTQEPDSAHETSSGYVPDTETSNDSIGSSSAAGFSDGSMQP